MGKTLANLLLLVHQTFSETSVMRGNGVVLVLMLMETMMLMLMLILFCVNLRMT